MALECHLTGADIDGLASAVAATADASAYVLETETDWRLQVSELLLGSSGTHLAAPAHRFCSAQQGALMLREGQQLAEWTTARGSTVIGVGGNVPGAQYNLRYPGDSDDVVRLLSEVLVPELIAARAWQTQRM